MKEGRKEGGKVEGEKKRSGPQKKRKDGKEWLLKERN